MSLHQYFPDTDNTDNKPGAGTRKLPRCRSGYLMFLLKKYPKQNVGIEERSVRSQR
jgi:hypothetical protein